MNSEFEHSIKYQPYLPEWVKEVDLPVENDEGRLIEVINEPLFFKVPKLFYPFANMSVDGRCLTFGYKYLRSKEEHDSGRMEEMTAKHPERYAARILAWFNDSL